MKNIETIVKELGIEVDEETLPKLIKATNENYKAITDYEKQRDKVSTLEEDLKKTKEALQAFDGVDVDAYQAQIEALKKDIEAREDALKKKDDEYAAELASRDFNDLIDRSITSRSGKNAKAIKALLDIETLKASKNQQADIDKALDDLVSAEDSSMLFGEPDPTHIGTGDLLGTVRKSGQNNDLTMGSAIADHYTK